MPLVQFSSSSVQFQFSSSSVQFQFSSSSVPVQFSPPVQFFFSLSSVQFPQFSSSSVQFPLVHLPPTRVQLEKGSVSVQFSSAFSTMAWQCHATYGSVAVHVQFSHKFSSVQSHLQFSLSPTIQHTSSTLQFSSSSFYSIKLKYPSSVQFSSGQFDISVQFSWHVTGIHLHYVIFARSVQWQFTSVQCQFTQQSLKFSSVSSSVQFKFRSSSVQF